MKTLDVQWSEPSTYQATGVHHGYRTAVGRLADFTNDMAQPSQVGLIVRKVWWGMLEPGGFLVPHIDKGPYWVRWHYPVEAAGYVWQDGNWPELMESPTEPFEIAHWEPHAVWNPSDKRRVHLIVELDEQVPNVDHSHDLELYPMLPEIQELIDAL